MKRLLYIIIAGLCTFTIAANALAAPSITFENSKILGLWSFMQSISGDKRASSIIEEIFKKSVYNSSTNRKEIKEFKKIWARSSERYFRYNGYPKNRPEMGWGVQELFELNSTKSKDLKEFASRTSYVIPFSDHRRIFNILQHFLPIYETLIWSPNLNSLENYRKNLVKISQKTSAKELFKKANKFYKGNWPDDNAITVYIYPIPASKGNTFATIISNSVILQALLDEKDSGNIRFGIIFHEICHGIFRSQTPEFQEQMDNWFNQADKTRYGKYTYDLINEALATAIGNGLAYKVVSGEEDNGPWYNNEDINGLAKGIYPKVKEYFDRSKSIDKAFIDYAIQQYKKTFPYAPYMYEKLLSEVFLATEGKLLGHQEASKILDDIFNSPSIYHSSPIDSGRSLQTLKEMPEKSAFIFVVSQQSLAQLDAVENIVPDIKDWKKYFKQQGEWVFVSISKTDNPVIIFKIERAATFKKYLQKLKDEKRIKEKVDFMEGLV